MLVSFFDFRGKLTSVEELPELACEPQNNKWYFSISYTVRDEEVSVILQPIEKSVVNNVCRSVKIYVKAATVVNGMVAYRS